MVKFITPNEEVIEYNKLFNEVKADLSPFKEILKKSNFSSFYFVKGEAEEDKISLGDAFQLQVNAKDIGVFHFLFKAEDFKKEQVVKEIATLKEINVEDSESAKYKVTSLINIVKEYGPLFMVYKEEEHSRLYGSEIRYIVNESFPSFVILIEDEMNDEIKELNINPDEVPVTTEKKPKDKITKGRILNDLNKNKFHLSLIFVSTLLVMISTPLAVYNIYAKNYLYIFLFIFAAAGIGMNTYSYYDYFKRKDISNPVFLFSVIANLLGIGAGIGLLAIFYSISAKIENAPNLGSLILIGVLITTIIGVGTTVITYFIPKAKKNKK